MTLVVTRNWYRPYFENYTVDASILNSDDANSRQLAAGLLLILELLKVTSCK